MEPFSNSSTTQRPGSLTRLLDAAEAAPRSQQYDRRIAEALEQQNKLLEQQMKALETIAEAAED